MAVYESADLFGAMSDARDRAVAVPAEIHEGVEELLTIALLAHITPDRVDRLSEVIVDCAPDVRPVVASLIASLVARPRDQQRKIVAATKDLIEPPALADDAFAGVNWETFRDG
jgi:hypothetical protein